MKDPGAGRAAIAALVVAALWAQGGAWRTVAGAILLTALATPGPEGKSLLTIAAEQLRSVWEIWT